MSDLLNGHAAAGGAAGAGPRALDPRARIVAVVSFAVTVVALTTFGALGAALGLALGAMAWARLPAGPTLKRVAVMDGFIVLMILMLPFTVPGQPLFTLWGLTASLDGVLRALEIALKANAIVLMMLALAGTMDAVTLGHALSRLGLPDGLVHLLLFTVRYIAVLGDEYGRLRTAMRARAFRPRNSHHTYRAFGYLVGMLLVRALERSERILEAMKCRGFDGRLHLLDALRFRRADALFAGLWGLTLAALAWIEVAHGAAF
ncbi:MAG: cobalt ECF transporter T component CbiQ [Rhodobacterales bacterium]|nr:cobalt ECF transporter T component CbiQ [Rhodobacterales bacterium]